MNVKFNLITRLVCFFCLICLSCNIFYVSIENVPVFFSKPEKVKNKIKDPIKNNVRLSALWIGHSTVLLQIEDKVIITDPFFTETVGELARRVIEPGIDVHNIPKCDLILISHSHFDHLSLGSLEILETKSDNTFLVFPEDLENYLPYYNFNLVRMTNDEGYKNKIIGEEKIVNDIKVTSVFAQHWGGRYGLDGYLWGDNAYTGFIIEYKGIVVYFAGDTGYNSSKFKILGEKFKIDLALIPIGPCADCGGCGTRNHVFPVDAVKIFRDVKARWMMPIHYGTLHFAQAHPIEPVLTLSEIINSQNLKDSITVLKIGEQRIYFNR